MTDDDDDDDDTGLGGSLLDRAVNCDTANDRRDKGYFTEPNR